MPDKDENFYAGHRDRLRAKFLDGQLADYEKLELLLAYAIPRRDVRPLARSLVKQFGGVYQVLSASIDDLTAVKGIGNNTAVFIKLVQQMMTINYRGQLKETPIFHNETILHNYCRIIVAGKTVEELHILYLDSNLRLVVDEIHSTGTIDSSAVYPREIARRALELNARSIVMVHNHPTSNNSFSRDDIEITTLVQSVLAGLSIELYDHFVVSNDIVYSARQMHLI
ncbi:MAG: RadC family protein [Alphaproteobacteria bacterium]|nr:RadC family protein [Alphaproteobacteria bacterium]